MDNLAISRRNCLYYKPRSNKVLKSFDGFLTSYEVYRKKLGKRRMSDSEREEYQRHLVIILLDLIAVLEGDPARYIGYSRSHKYFIQGGGYWDLKNGRAILSERVFLSVIDFLEDDGLIENHKAKAGYGGFSSRMRATPMLSEIFRERGLNWTSIGYDQDAPVLILKDTEIIKDKDNKKQKRKFKVIELPKSESLDVEQAVANLHRINFNLEDTYINLSVSDEQHKDILGDIACSDTDDNQPREAFELSNRFLRRIFAEGKFESGGRFYGGWWQGIPSEYRKHIVIDGAVTREMDYSSMQPRLMYAETGIAPPKDAYAVTGWPPEIRPFAKKAFNQLVNSDKSSQHENQWHRFAPKIKLPTALADWSRMTKYQKNKARCLRFKAVFKRPYTDLLRDLLNMHSPIDKFFFLGAWGRMQRLDSDIAELVLIKLLNLDVPVTALPIHDSFIVRRGAESDLHRAMNEAFEELIGEPCDISFEEAIYDQPDGYERTGPILMADIVDNASNEISERKIFSQRANEWQQAFGPVDV